MKRICLFATLIFMAIQTNAQQKGLKAFDINQGQYSSSPHEFTVLDNKLYFFALGTLHSLDTLEQVKKLTNFETPTPSIRYQNGIPNRRITQLNGDIFFLGENTMSHDLILKLDNNGVVTEEATMVNFATMDPNYLTPHQGKLYFSMATLGRRSLFVFDPITKKVTQLTDSFKTGISNIYDIVSYKDRIYFTARQYSHPYSGLFTYDPNLNITWQLSIDSLSKYYDYRPSKLVVHNNKLYYFGSTKFSKNLMEYDGTNIPKLIKKIWFPDNTNIVLYNNSLYYNELNSFFYSTVHKNRLYIIDFDKFFGGVFKYDGQIHEPINLNVTEHNGIVSFNGNLYGSFFDRSTNIGIELYRIDPEMFTDVQNLNISNIDVKLYPNPVKDVAHIQFNLKGSQTLNISLTDMSGRVVYKTDNVLYSASLHNVDMPVSNLPSGNYIYTISNTNRIIHSGKVIIE